MKEPKHIYTIEWKKPLVSEELWQLYEKYERTIHNKDEKTIDGMKSHICSSPAYDPGNEDHSFLKERIAPSDFTLIDDGKE